MARANAGTTFLSWLILVAGTADASEIVLRSASCTVTIQPETMRVAAQPLQGETILLSAGQTDLGTPEIVGQTSKAARWKLPARDVTVSATLSDAEFSVEIRSRTTGEFTWPVLELSPPSKALIWPYWEGRYVPLDDPRWIAFLKQHEWNTLEGLCMPFWGLQRDDLTVTYIATNRCHNTVRFDTTGGHLRARFTHTFPASKSEWAYGFVIRLSESTSPVEPARVFRRWLVARGEFVPMREKLKTTPKAERLLGAPHVYLWGDALFTRHDAKRTQWRAFCQTLVEQTRADAPSVGKRVHELMDAEHWQHVEQIAGLEWPYDYIKSQVASALSRILERKDFYHATAWRGVAIPPEAQALLACGPNSLPLPKLCRMNALLLHAAYPDFLLPVEEWGDGVSTKMLRRLKEAGLDHLRLCLAGWEGIEKRPEVATSADELGYLFGTYDSFHSIHDPALNGTDATWATAQFDAALHENGAIVRQDGSKRSGFKRRGYLLSPHAAQPYVERRVTRNMRNVPYSYYFVDCDAYGQVYDDYSPLHLSTQQQDAAARVARLAWIRDTFNVVIGSEGGSSYAAPAVHVVEGMVTPVIGWGDPDLKNKESKYYVGGYYPPDGPRVFLESVPLKPEYEYLHYDPRFRLPLNEMVFHDCFVSTHHWGSGSLKFSNVAETVALLELLYQCPPLYHLNLDEFERRRDRIKKHYDFFSPIHRAVGFAPMTDFAWLTSDRLVQRTVFGRRIELIVNFGKREFDHGQCSVPAGSARARWLSGEKTLVFRPRD